MHVNLATTQITPCIHAFFFVVYEIHKTVIDQGALKNYNQGQPGSRSYFFSLKLKLVLVILWPYFMEILCKIELFY